MRILGINGSPRGNGHTSQLVRAALEGAAEQGVRTRHFELGEMDITGCQGCMGCRDTGRCGREDDMQRFYGEVEKAGAPAGLVIGTPIYFGHISAQLKAWMDRLFCYTLTESGEVRFPGGFRAVIVATWEARDKRAYESVLDWLDARLHNYYGIDVVGSLGISGCPMEGVAELGEGIERANQLGVKLVEGNRQRELELLRHD